MNFNVWEGDSNDRTCIDTFTAPTLEAAMAEVKANEVQPLLDNGWDCWLEDGDDQSYCWQLSKAVDTEALGLIAGQDFDLDDPPFADWYVFLEAVKEFASWHPTAYAV